MFSYSTPRPSTAVKVGQSPSKLDVFTGFTLLDLCLFPPCLVWEGFVSLVLPELGAASGWVSGDDVMGSGMLIIAL